MLGQPRFETRSGDDWHVVDGVCEYCGAERSFAVNMTEADKRSFKSMDEGRHPQRPAFNEIHFTWD